MLITGPKLMKKIHEKFPDISKDKFKVLFDNIIELMNERLIARKNVVVDNFGRFKVKIMADRCYEKPFLAKTNLNVYHKARVWLEPARNFRFLFQNKNMKKAIKDAVYRKDAAKNKV